LHGVTVGFGVGEVVPQDIFEPGFLFLLFEIALISIKRAVFALRDR